MKPIFLKCLPFLGMALATTPAWAGSWTVGLDYDGKRVSGSVTRPWAYDDENGIYQSAWTYSSNFSGSSSGKFILVLGWRASSPGEKIPPSVTVRIQQKVQGSGGRKDMSAFPSPYNPAPGTPGSVTLSTQVATPDGATFPDSTHERKLDDGYNSYSSLSQNPPALVVVSTQGAVAQQGGSFLVRYPLPSIKGSFDVTPGNYTIETEPHNFDTYSDGCWAMVTASVAFALDNREVYLTRGSAPKIKGASDVTIDESRDEWREVDSSGLWTTHGQSRWSYTERTQDTYLGAPTYPINPVTIKPVINAQAGGGWSSNLTGVWSNPAPTDTQPPQSATASHTETLPDGGALNSKPDGIPMYPAGWYNTPSKGQNPVTVTYNLTDNNDGAKATAKYVFHLHDEFEQPRTGTLPNRVYNTEYPIKVDGRVKWYSSKVTRKVSGKVTHTWKVSLTAGFKLKDLFNLFPEANAGGTGEYGGTKEFSVDESMEKTITPGKHCYYYVLIHDELKHHLVDHYEASGYTGTQDVWFDDARAGGYEPRFSKEYPDTDFDSRDHIDPNDVVDQDADYKDL